MNGETTLTGILSKLTDKEKQYLKNLIFLDELTSVYNRKFFFEALEKEIHRAEISDSDVTLLFVDIDGFKNYQDNHPDNHFAGDGILRMLAHYLNKKTKDFDMVCRYAGDEFVVIIPNSDLENGLKISERLRSGIAKSYPLTVSIGVANYKGNANNLHELLFKADQGAKLAKKAGGNCCQIYTENKT